MRPRWPRAALGWGKLRDGELSLSYQYGTWRRENSLLATGITWLEESCSNYKHSNVS